MRRGDLIVVQSVMAEGDVYKVRLESIAPLGDAIGRIEGKTVFVEGGAPQEMVLCRITGEHMTWARAQLLEIIEPSPARVDKTCAFYGKCGGCNLQHIDYDAQLAAKASILTEHFTTIGDFAPPKPEVVPSPPWEYRNRVQFHCLRQKAKSEGPSYGLKGRGSGEIIAVTDCPVAAFGIRKLLRDGEPIPMPPEKDRFTVFSAGELFLSEGGVERGKIKVLEKEITIDAGVFFQSNIAMLEKLITELRSSCNAEQAASMADLYCGVGTFALFLGDTYAKTILAEENKRAVAIARENLKGMNTEFFALRDTEWDRTILRRSADFGFAVVDPPRAGLALKLAQAMAHNGPPVLAYVSCDSASLARDSKILTDGGYQLDKLILFDFYPQTSHIETLAVFKR
jgi:23S rRNA (uracil1939-C5)-methyltransferase